MNIHSATLVSELIRFLIEFEISFYSYSVK